VIVTAWRIVKRKHVKSAFSGDGARLFGGRWNNPGVPLIYTAASQSLAVLEILVHLEAPEILGSYVMVGVGVEESLITGVDASRLPKNWRTNPAPPGVRAIGDEWAAARVSAVLRVPSVIVPSESNLLLNPLHRDFSRLKIADSSPFRFDSRLLKPHRTGP
jgi:RES domain-containing protein